MNLTISGHHLEVTPPLRAYVLTKLDRVTRHFDQVVDINVLLSVEKLKEKERRQKRPGESDALTPDLEQKQVDQYSKVFRIFRENKDKVTSVTFWNISDRYTWLDNYPVPGRKNYPLLFDTNLQPKKAYWEVVNFKNK